MDLVGKQNTGSKHTLYLEFTASYPVTRPRRETREWSGTHSQALSLPGRFPGFGINEVSSDDQNNLQLCFPSILTYLANSQSM